MRWLVVVLMCVSSIAHADDPDALYLCKEPSPNAKLSATFKPETSIAELATWALGFTCKNIVFNSDVAKHATKVTVMSPKPMTPKQAMQLFVDSIEATGLVVVQKPDTIIIKLGPGMPASCPDTDDADDVLAKALDAGIRHVDETHVEITRAAVDAVLASTTAVAKAGRIVPAVKDGKAAGLKLYAIRPSSVLARLGLINGDTVLAINGTAITTADRALEIYASLRTAKQITIDLERRGRPLTLSIAIK